MPVDSVSLIICTKDRAPHLERTLASLATVHNPESLTVELLIVDNNSSDETASVARQQAFDFHSTRVLHEPNEGLANARNRALEVATGNILLFTDDDVRFPENWIAGMTRPIRTGNADAVAGGVEIAPHLTREWMEPWHLAFLASSHRIETDPPTDMVGANMCFGRHVLSEVPRFDPSLGAGSLGFCEESVFATKLLRAGFQIAPAFDIAVEHHFAPSRLSRESFLSAARKLGRSMAYIHYTHFPERDTFPENLIRAYTELLRMRATLGVKRAALRPQAQQQGPPVPNWENYHVRRIAYLKQAIRERF